MAGNPMWELPAILIVDKPLVCQEDYLVACKSKICGQRPGTGMHFYRKCKHLLCKKCQK